MLVNARHSVFGPVATAPWSGPFRGSSSITNLKLDDATDAIEFILQAEEAAAIEKLGFLYVSFSGTCPTFQVSLQGVSGGVPDGTIKGGGTPASATFNPDSLGWSGNTFQWVTLSNAYSCSRGELLSIVIKHSSGTIDGSNNANFGTGFTIVGNPQKFPVAIHNNAGSRSYPGSLAPCFGYRSSTKRYGTALQSTSWMTYSSISNPDEYGIKFTRPGDFASQYKLLGVKVWLGSGITSGGSTKMILYGGTDATAANSTGAITESTIIQDYTIPHDLVIGAVSNGLGFIVFDESTLATLYGDAVYRLAFQPQASNQFEMGSRLLFPSESDKEGNIEGLLTQLTKRTDAGNWVDVPEENLAIELMLSEIDGGGGAGTPTLAVLPRRSSVLSKL